MLVVALSFATGVWLSLVYLNGSHLSVVALSSMLLLLQQDHLFLRSLLDTSRYLPPVATASAALLISALWDIARSYPSQDVHARAEGDADTRAGRNRWAWRINMVSVDQRCGPCGEQCAPFVAISSLPKEPQRTCALRGFRMGGGTAWACCLR